MPDLMFYDGGCGLCHHSVAFVARRDSDGSRFRYAPLGGPTFLEAMPPGERGALPDSIVVRTVDGRTLVRSAALLHVARRLGGGWARLAALAGLVPRALLDLGYDGIARIRRHLFTPPAGACPVLPAELRARFLA